MGLVRAGVVITPEGPFTLSLRCSGQERRWDRQLTRRLRSAERFRYRGGGASIRRRRMYDFTGRVVIVTGAAGNLGMVLARAFHKNGANLALVDHKAERLAQVYHDLAGSPSVLLGPATDLASPDAVSLLVQTVLERFQHIDVLANTAGGYRAGEPLHETPLEAWDSVMNLNARSVFLVCRAVIPPMLRQQYGKIINIGSRNSLKGTANSALYDASKTVVLRLTESMSAELQHHGINVNCILPGTMDTPQNRAANPDADYSRWVRPEEIAELALFLASDASAPIHGAAIPAFGRT